MTDWQPMHTAPRDDTRILVTDGKNVSIMHFHTESFPRIIDPWWLDLEECMGPADGIPLYAVDYRKLTGWQPLPTP